MQLSENSAFKNAVKIYITIIKSKTWHLGIDMFNKFEQIYFFVVEVWETTLSTFNIETVSLQTVHIDFLDFVQYYKMSKLTTKIEDSYVFVRSFF